MVHKLSSKITTFFINRGSIKADDREMYEYCFEVLLSTIINLLLLIVIGIATGKYLETFIFAVVFMLSREVCGGYHARTHLGCVCSLLVLYGAMLGLTYLNANVLFILSLVFFSIAFIVFLLIAPVDCANKRISKEERTKLRKRMFIILLLFVIAYSIMMVFEVTRIYAFCIACSMFNVMLLVVLGFLINIFSKKNEICE